MEANEVLIESFNRVREHVHGVLDGIDEAWLTRTPVEGVNWSKRASFGHAQSRFAYTTPRTFRINFGVRF